MAAPDKTVPGEVLATWRNTLASSVACPIGVHGDVSSVEDRRAGIDAMM
jgi:hypothetical protein